MVYQVQKLKLGEILLSHNVITEEQLENALKHQKEKNIKLGEALIELGYTDEDTILSALSVQLDIPYESLDEYAIDPEVVHSIPDKVARRYHVVPVSRTNNILTLAMTDPLNVQAIDDIQLMLNVYVQPIISKKSEIQKLIDEYYVSEDTVENIIEGLTEKDIEIIKDEADLTSSTAATDSEAPAIKLVNLIILEAIKNRASDVHLEPFEDHFYIRQRLDGVLHLLPEPPRHLWPGLISRIKVMADLNIAETRLPQDGRIKLKLSGREIDLRVSCLPTVFGESVVLRVLDRGTVMLKLDQLGFQEDDLKKTRQELEQPNGIIIVTGPTGCGKTTTLYAGITEINRPEDKLITVEDPVEYEIPGLVQVQVNERVGLTFASALRSILRQDPDIVMIGEVRDVETAEIAVQASLTGHLVLATLHTNEAASAITRLVDMGIEPFLLTSTVRAIIGERLIRVNCEMCKEPYEPSPELFKELGVKEEEYSDITFYKGRGCEECANTGFKGRIGIFEFLPMVDPIRELVLSKEAAAVIHQEGIRQGMRPMFLDGWLKAKAGITTLEEVIRVAPLSVGH
ncbi:MAG: ATPase, T2SS/T4P/T4SS family [Candidatus Hydrogenedentota bacterium]